MCKGTATFQAGYELDSIKLIIVPLCQTAAYGLDGADHAATVCNSKVQEFRYGRIGDATTSVLDKRIAGRTAYIAPYSSFYQRVAGSSMLLLSAFLLLWRTESVVLWAARLGTNARVTTARAVARFLHPSPNGSWVRDPGFGDINQALEQA